MWGFRETVTPLPISIAATKSAIRRVRYVFVHRFMSGNVHKGKSITKSKFTLSHKMKSSRFYYAKRRVL